MNEPSTTSESPDLSAADRAPCTALTRGVSPGLFFAPVFVVSALVLAWLLLLRWLNADYDPHDLLRDMRAPGRGSWQKAYAFSELLHDPRHVALKEDATLCRDLASVLDDQLRAADPDPAWIKSQIFLCRALGEFRVPDGLPTLLRAAETSHSEARVEVRCAALAALAALAGNLPPGELRSNQRTIAELLDASHDSNATGGFARGNRVASTATFALGVIGGAEATQRLQQLLHDPRPDVRYNAATGLARHGDDTAIPVLLEMLAADDSALLDDQSSLAVRERTYWLLLSNAIHATVRLIETNPQVDRQALRQAVEQLGSDTSLPMWLRLEVQAALQKLCDGETSMQERGGL
jgi:HEAT repeat protein